MALFAIGAGLSYSARRTAVLLELEEERELLTIRIHQTRTLSKSWGYRNDSFDLLKQKHPDFAKLHLRDPDLLGNQRVMLFLDLDGQIAFNSLEHIPSPTGSQALPELRPCLASISNQLTKALQSITRLCSSRSGPYILAASPIANDTWDAPVNGTVGIFTPVDAMPSASIKDIHLQQELELLSRNHLIINPETKNSSKPWPPTPDQWQASLPLDQDFGIDHPADHPAMITSPIHLTTGDWIKSLIPLGLVAAVLSIRHQWSMLLKRQSRLNRLRNTHSSLKADQSRRRRQPEHGLLTKEAFTDRFSHKTAWNWSINRCLVLIELDLNAEAMSDQGIAITLEDLLPSLCKSLCKNGYSEIACQYNINSILACLPCQDANGTQQSELETRIKALHKECSKQIDERDVLAPWKLTITHCPADRNKPLGPQVNDLALTAIAARRLGLDHMALNLQNHTFRTAQREQQAAEDVILTLRDERPLEIALENTYHCPLSDPNHWAIHHQRIRPVLSKTNRKETHQNQLEACLHDLPQDLPQAIAHRLGLDNLLLKKMIASAYDLWESSQHSATFAIRIGRLRKGELQDRVEAIRRCLHAMPTELRDNLIFAIDTHSLTDDEASELIADLQAMGPRVMHDNPGFGLAFECAPNYIRINCKELDHHATDTLMSLYRLLQDAGQKLDFKLVGEGISSEAQFHLWHKLGLRLFQGAWIEHMAHKVQHDYPQAG